MIEQLFGYRNNYLVMMEQILCIYDEITLLLMGCCCSSQQQVRMVNVPKILVQQQPQLSQFQPPSLYLLGELSQGQSVFYTFHHTSSEIIKFKLPNYHPKNYSSMIMVENSKFIITGGLNYQMLEIFNQCVLFDANTNTVQQLPSMQQPRYTHNSLYYRNYVYVFGGRYYGDDHQAILSHCQRFKIGTNKWQVLSPMPTKRCTGFSIVWNNGIYVLGGYSGQFDRPRSIDWLNTESCKWVTLGFWLSYGIQSGCVRASNDNEFMIFGGLTNEGASDKVLTVNLKQQTIKSNLKLKSANVLSKSFALEEWMYILGGNEELMMEKYNIKDQKSECIDIGLAKHLKLEQFQTLTYSQQTINVPYSKVQKQLSKPQYNDQIIYVFGTNEEPFIIEFNISIPAIQVRGVPLSITLYAHQGGVSLSNGSFVLFGGILDSFTEVSSETYIYDSIKNTGRECSKMNKGRYAFGFRLFKEHIYAMGGGRPDENGELVVLSCCERFNIKKEQWDMIGSLPSQVISPMSIVHKDNLYLFGGMNQQKQRQTRILKYEESKDSWNLLNFKLPFGIQAGSLFQNSENEFYIFGGRLVNGDTDGIWSLTLLPKDEFIFVEKGRMKEPKCLHQIHSPKHQNFLIVFGGQKQPVSCYDRITLKNVQSDTLFGIKELFTKTINNVNDTSMKNYLILMKSN